MKIQEIPIVLSRLCRFGGHCQEFYSVAQHSCIVHDICHSNGGLRYEELALAGLLHDVHEVYTGFGDVIRPMKQFDDRVKEFLSTLEEFVDRAVAELFDVDQKWFSHRIVKEADLIALKTEHRDIAGEYFGLDWDDFPADIKPLPDKIEPWEMDDAVRGFVYRLNQYGYNIRYN